MLKRRGLLLLAQTVTTDDGCGVTRTLHDLTSSLSLRLRPNHPRRPLVIGIGCVLGGTAAPVCTPWPLGQTYCFLRPRTGRKVAPQQLQKVGRPAFLER